jgi:hypothetical protein
MDIAKRSEPLVRMLESVRIDDNREYIEFCLRDADGERQSVQIDFDYVESLAALFQQAFVSATMEDRQGANRSYGREYLSVPRLDLDQPVSVAVDVMTERVVAIFMLGTPFQASYSMPVDVARKLSDNLLSACGQVSQQRAAMGRMTN